MSILALLPNPRDARYSLMATIASSSTRKGSMTWVTMDRASAVKAAAAVATEQANELWRRQACSVATATYKPSTAAAVTGASTWKRMVSSHSMGARMSAEVPE